MRKGIFDRKFFKQISHRFLPILGMIFSLIIISSTVTILYQKIGTKGTDIEGFRNASTYSQAIVGDFVYNDIVVRVEAPVGAFPEGTELRITPITAKKQMAEIKDSLIKNTDVTEESKAVSFDISFIYTMSDGEEVELQPREGYKVKVAFNYFKDEGFRQVEESEDREIKIYHLEGVKEESCDIIVQEVDTNEKESSKGELVLNADRFSVYSMAGVDTPELRAVQSTQLDNFSYGVITFRSSNNSTCISLMDRNLGATSTGAGTDASASSYGYYYQWGNNYGFTVQSAANNYITDTIDVSGVNPSEYSSSNFVAKNSWAIGTQSKVQDLRGGGNDNNNNQWGQNQSNYINRQGPCPSGWHVPSAYEMGLVVQYRGQSHGYTVTSSSNFYYVNLVNKNKNRDIYDNFNSDLQIPYAGYITRFGRTASNYAFWSSTAPYYSSSEYNGYLYQVRLANNFAIGLTNSYRQRIGYAYPVRCFYNSLSCDDIPEPYEPSLNTGCNLPWGGTVEHGASVTGYQAATVPYGQSCAGVQATCNNGDWSVNNFTLDYPYSGCTVADPVGCTFKGQPIAHEGSLVVYSTSSEFCPDTCTAGTVTCYNGTLGGNTGYTNLSCNLEPVGCDSSYNLSSTGANGTYSSCTPYTVNGNSCTPGTTLYKLDSCNSGYTQVGDTCKQNCTFNGQSIPHGSSVLAYSESLEMCPDECRFETRTCNDGQLSGSYTNTSCTVTPVSCSEDFYPFTTCPANGICTQSCIPYTVNNNSCTIGTAKYQLNGCESGYHSEDLESCTGDTKQVQCIQGYKPSNSNYVPSLVWISWQGTRNNGSWSAANDCTWVCNEHYHTGANNESCEIDKFNIIWKNSDGSTLKIDTGVAYGSIPSYNGETPMSGGNAQYSYEFAGWSPEISQVTGNITYTAVYTKTIKNYTVLINSSNINSGTVSTLSITVPYGTDISINSNILTIFNETITATPNPQTTQYTHQFVDWTNTCGDIITTGCTIIANFSSTLRTYTVTWKNSNGTTLETDSNVEYGTTPAYDGETPTSGGDAQYSYTFAGWTPSISSVTGNIEYTAVYTQIVNQYTATILTSPSGYGSVDVNSVTKIYNSSILISGDTITIGGTTVIASPLDDSAEFDYEFSGWINNCGDRLIGDCSIIANFIRTVKSYTVTFDSNGGNYTPSIQTIQYGLYASKPSDPERTGYDFNGWSLNGMSFNFNTAIEEDIILVADWDTIRYTITYIDRGEIVQLNPDIYTIKDYIKELPKLEREGYIFSGWYENGNLITNIPIGSYGDKELVAQWAPKTDTPYTVEYYLENLDNDKYTLIETETLTGTTDAQTNVVTKDYTGFTLVGNIAQYQTIIRGDGSTVVELYYTRNFYEIIFLNDGELEILGSGLYKYGTNRGDIDIPKDPTRPGTELYEYMFIGWTPEITDVTTGAIYLAAYEAHPIPQIRFLSPTPEDGTEWSQNRFTTKVKISNMEIMNNMTYEVKGDNIYNIARFNYGGLNYGYNFDNVAELGEVTNTLVKSIESKNDGVVYGATRVSSGRYGGAYYFDGVDDYIELSLGNGGRTPIVEFWAKPEGGEWTHLIISAYGDLFINGKASEILPVEFANVAWPEQNAYIGTDGKGNYFAGLIDEVKYYRMGINEQILYKSNLRKISGDVWEFEIVNTCLGASGSYDYSLTAYSDIGITTSTGRSLTTNIPGVSVEGTGYDFGIYETTGSSYVLSGTMGRLIVTDYLGKSGWKVYFTTSPTLVGQTTQETIDTNNLKFKATNLVYSGLYNGVSNTHVTFGNGISTDQYRTAHGNKETDNILEYIIRTESADDFMCGDVGTYSDNTQIQLDVPAWQVEDEYEGILWITLQEEINVGRSPVLNPINPGGDLKK